MRKFKIKNRRKRKYVKKSELASSFSSVQSLTVGVVPLILMAIAFCTTFLISNPSTLSSAKLPEVILPEVQFTWELPALPEFELPSLPTLSSLPTLTLPDMPTITFPNIIPQVTAGFTSIANGIGAFIQATIQAINTLGMNLYILVEKFVTILDPTPIFIALGKFSSNVLLYTGDTIVKTYSALGNSLTLAATAVRDFTLVSVTALGDAITNAVTFLDDLTLRITQTLTVWTNTTIKAVGDALNAFVWFIGTPFRALGVFFAELGVTLTPLNNFLADSFDQSLNELSVGGETLFQSTNYVSETVAEQK